jgi:hypothetical protein
VLIRGLIRHSDGLSASAVDEALAELREILRAMTRRVAMLEVELAGRQVGRADVEDLEVE